MIKGGELGESFKNCCVGAMGKKAALPPLAGLIPYAPLGWAGESLALFPGPVPSSLHSSALLFPWKIGEKP